jgi:2-polyprenyl-6-methoxyphenol hydroxylase-like FAD-dependent oxidoreductase
VKGTWVLTQMPPGWDPNAAHPQSEINDYYLKRASLVTGASEEDLKKAGVSGPIAGPNSQPTVFALQGKAASKAAEVLPDGTIVGFMGDAVETSTFQAGGGMNTAVTDVLPAMTLLEELDSGVAAQEAARHYEEAVFERGDAWSVAGIQYFYPELPPGGVQKLIKAHLQAIRDWRREGGASPLERMQEILKNNPLPTEPVGMKLAA